MPQDAIAALTIDDFSALTEQTLELEFAGQRQAANIIDVKAGTATSGMEREPFSVVIRSGAKNQHWPQGTHTLHHPEHGALDLFMVPIGPDTQGMCYEISFA